MKCPTGKIVFTTRISAWQSAIKNSNRFGHKLVPYHCTICKRIHLTKREDTVKGSVIPYRVGMSIDLETGKRVKKPKRHKKPKRFYTSFKEFHTMKYRKTRLDKIPEWKKKILRFVIKLLRI